MAFILKGAVVLLLSSLAVIQYICTNTDIDSGNIRVTRHNMNMPAIETRPYRQKVRAAAAEATAHRILAAFSERLRTDWYEEIKLEEVARCAGVTIQTVIRRFGGKEGLLKVAAQVIGEEVVATRGVVIGDAPAAIRALIDDYEESGDLVIRILAQENRHLAIKQVTDIGRRSHRDWIEAAFAPWLEGLTPADGRSALDKLVVASDVYVWKLVRRDMGRSVGEYRRILTQMLAAALGATPDDFGKGMLK